MVAIHTFAAPVVTSHLRALAAQRDALLPMLISGELRLPDAEHFLALASPTITEVQV